MRLMNHACIIRLIEIIENQNNKYIVTELLQDGDLFDYILSKQHLQEAEAAVVMRQLMDATQYIHRKGFVHRDLKPENIMIVLNKEKDQIKTVKIIDFGFAQLLEHLQLHGQKGICGTPNYLCPEILQNKPIDQKVDNFSLGAIMYFLLSGFLPFDAEFPDEVIRNTLEGEYNFNDEVWSRISEEAKDLIQSFLQPDPTQRISLDEALKHPWFKVECKQNGHVQ